jgi:hypothetical protein
MNRFILLRHSGSLFSSRNLFLFILTTLRIGEDDSASAEKVKKKSRR